MSRAFGLGAALALVTAGCSVPFGASLGVQQINTCSSPHDCAEGATCEGGICVATNVDLTGMLVEVRPHANASFGATTSYVFDPSAKVALSTHGQGAEPFLARFDPRLPAPVSIRGGRVLFNHQTMVPATCAIPDRSVPAQITFFRVPPYAGLPFDPIHATAIANNKSESTFDVDLVPDTYDVYVEPQAVPGCNDDQPLPPWFLPRQPITSGVALSWELPVPGALKGHIAGFTGVTNVTVDDFAIAVLEPTRGLPISANGKLTASGDGFDLSAQVSWQDMPYPILRLSPVDPKNALPSVYWTLVGSDFQNLQFTVQDLFTQTTKVGGQVQTSDGSSGVPAALFIQSLMLNGTNGQNATFAVNATADAQGNFTVSLPPGSYQFRAVPQDERFAVTDETKPIGANATSCMCGINITLAPRVTLAGTATTPTGQGLVDASVSTSPSQTVSTSYWLDTHAIDPVNTRAASTITDEMGQFQLLVDPGSSDLTIEAGASSNYPWLVRPRFTIQADAQPTPFALTSPAFLSGTVTDPLGLPVVNAEINAWFPVRDASAPMGGLTGTVVRIATTSSGIDGTFTLVLPSKI